MQPNQGLHQLFFLFDPEWYESLDHYQPNDELLRIVRTIIPPTWRLVRSSQWFNLYPAEVKLPRQGWKIHVSATPANCEDVLRKTVAVCAERETPFKFCLDRRLASLSGSKIYPREASGKFMTIYPLSDQQFHEMIEVLYVALQGFVGPYVLSDRRYKDSQVVYYRYGGMDGFSVLSSQGGRAYMLLSPDGELFPDVRAPYWSPPPWVSDPFEETDTDESEPVLKDGRYHIEQSLGFSVTGGIYLATDSHTGNSVVIKEARPATEFDEHGHDAVHRLRKEYRLLQKLAGVGITPAPIDLFQDWEHLFLVEEYIPGPNLGLFAARFNPLVRVYPGEKAMTAYVDKLRNIWTNLALGMAAMHDRGITHSDFSLRNVLVRDVEQGDVRIIDLEAAWEEGVDAPIQIETPGFASPTRRGAPHKEDDVYALGAMMLGTLFPINSLLKVEPSAKHVFIEATGADLGLSEQVRHVIEKCMSNEASERPTLRQVIEVIEKSPAQPAARPTETPVTREELLKVISDTTDYIRASANFKREDRLFPADPLVFLTNPLSITYGAVGIAYALKRIEGEISKSILAWILSHPTDPDHYPPGLYVGSAGIAWGLWELGLQDVAVQTLHAAANHPLLWDTADVFYGASGYGLTCLRFYLATGDHVWLDRAVQVGEWLLGSKVEQDDRGCCWSDKEGAVRLDYARGVSGIALYLLYLSLVTGERQFLETGKRALAFTLDHLGTAEEGHLTVPQGTVGSFDNVILPYWWGGSAGVATTLVRFWAYTKDVAYLDVLERLAPHTFQKYTVFPGLFSGLAGLGNVLLDIYDFTGEERYVHEAYRAASGVLLHKVGRPKGIAFPGEHLLRISTDFGTGSAGIALFLHRLAYQEQHRGDFNFTLDQFLPRHSVAENQGAVTAATASIVAR
ncbi:MAG: class III lanthionine synthetase LanKC [Chloroflexi bacterium]|nr:class III lanthionine synthetase LanKC [Ktedonobacteraceae bacterium]MBV9707001.1 class III lanthionine synthetase LanKC [Chloroflexota bacterium]